MTYPQTPDGPSTGAGTAAGSGSGPDPVTPNPRFPAIEHEVLEYWRRDQTFTASIAERDGDPEWVFYDGPPFANGLPHYGHLLTGYAKDLFPRFQTMRGKRVDRVFGWDTHGLPAELETMKQLGITEKSDVEAMGIGAFNAAARASVLRYVDEWEDYVTRQARWVDFDRGYKTLDTSYMESVLWAFKTLHDKGLAYEGYRVLPYCWRDETPLSAHELRMDDDVYKIRQDPSVTVTFPLVGAKAEALGLTAVRALAWTTTPWTLPTNLALAVGPDIRYVVVPAGPAGAADVLPGDDLVESAAHRFLLAEELLASYAKDLGYASPEDARAAVEQTFAGADLADVAYDRLFDYYADAEMWGTQHAWRILVDDYVTTTDGTGIVHQAPAYGEDDQRITEAAGIPLIISLDDGGRFLASVPDVAGELWRDANRPLIRMLRAEGRLLREASYEHPYPHCWRCRNPLIYKAVSSWFVRVTAIKDRLIALNQEITWAPENVKDGQFGKWLEGARDWSISRNRFWGSPIPVWQSDDPNHPRLDVYGSLDELERAFGRLPVNDAGEVDLHRPYIDELTRPNPDDPTGRSTMRRIEDVFDVWFDSASMPYAQVHYPFENREWFEEHSPADFIVEYIGQTRGWFYVMHVLSGALFDRPAFVGVACHGIVLGSDGYKMSKSLRNYPDVSEVFERDGSDAMRWFLMASSVLRGGNLVVTEEGIRAGVREFLLPLWNAWYFFATYANVAGGPLPVVERDTDVERAAPLVVERARGETTRGGDPEIVSSRFDSPAARSTTGAGYTARWRTDSTDPLDRYILGLMGDLVRGVADDLERLDSTTASAKLRDFAEALTNWYIRRSRDRFWLGVTDDPRSTEAFDTLYTVLETLTRVAAPLIPLVSERVWQGLTGGRSVHLEDWPDAGAFPTDAALRSAMDAVREVSSVGNALRKKEGKRVRLPLPRLTVAVPDAAALAPFDAVLRDELNVKTVELVPLTDDLADRYGITRRLKIEPRAAGPRLGKQVQHVLAGARASAWEERDGTVVVDGIALEPGEYELTLEAGGVADGTAIALLAGGGFVLLDTTTTAELEAEGLARDVIRAVQETRRAAGFDVSDRIRLELLFDDETDATAVADAFDAADVAGETLAVAFTVASRVGTLVSAGDVSGEPEPEHEVVVAVGAYANRGAFTVSVARTEPLR